MWLCTQRNGKEEKATQRPTERVAGKMRYHGIRNMKGLAYNKCIFVSDTEEETEESTEVEYSESETESEESKEDEESNVDGGNECKKRKREWTGNLQIVTKNK